MEGCSDFRRFLKVLEESLVELSSGSVMSCGRQTMVPTLRYV